MCFQYVPGAAVVEGRPKQVENHEEGATSQLHPLSGVEKAGVTKTQQTAGHKLTVMMTHMYKSLIDLFSRQSPF